MKGVVVMDAMRLEILRQVERGSLSPEEALRLLKAIDGPRGEAWVRLRAVEAEGQREKVNVLVPADAVVSAAKLGLALPELMGLNVAIDQSQLAKALESGAEGVVFERLDEAERLWFEVSIERS